MDFSISVNSWVSQCEFYTCEFNATLVIFGFDDNVIDSVEN